MTAQQLPFKGIAWSLSGGAVPALVGITATLVANAYGASDLVVVLLAAWTINGFLSLSDFGLTRAASTLVAQGHDPHVVLKRMRPASLLVGAALTLILVVGLAVVNYKSQSDVISTLWVMAPIPLITCHQFPLIGALEASGRFGVVAAHKSLSAISTYLVPAVLLPQGRTGLILGLTTLVAYRALAVIALRRFLPNASGSAAETDQDNAPTMNVAHLVTWVGASSLIGPLFLYLDRAFAAAGPAPVQVLILYTSISEILLRTYIVPTSLLSVVFPLTVRGLAASPHRVRRAYGRHLPLATIGFAAAAVAVVVVAPGSWLTSVGVSPENVDICRVLLVILGSGTIFNWSSQGQIAHVQAQGRQRAVVLAQGALIVPYLLLMIPASAHGIIAVALVWFMRILAMGVILWILGSRGYSRYAPAPLTVPTAVRES